MRHLSIILSLVVLALLSSGCNSSDRIGTPEKFREHAKKVSFDTDHSYTEITKILNKYGYKCLSSRLSFNGARVLISPTLRGNNKKATLSVQYDNEMEAENSKNSKGFYTLIMDIQKINAKSSHVDIYKGSDQFNALYKGVAAWMEGRRGCPDLFE